MSSKIYRFGVGKSTRKSGENIVYLYTLAEGNLILVGSSEHSE